MVASEALLLAAIVGLGAVPTVLNRVAKLCLLMLGRFFHPSTRSQESPSGLPFYPGVSIHLAITNEDPAVALGTLEALDRLDYPDYHVLVIDNNTVDESLWRPVETFCAQRPERFNFYHVERMAGYKAGALNYALERTGPAAEVVAVVDADTAAEPHFLRALVPYFSDGRVAVVQSPLGFRRDPGTHRFTAWVYLIYRYFLSIYMPAADRLERAPFIGAMGLVRRRALEECGGWDGFYLTEDMELSGRLFRRGYHSRFVNQVYGRSMPPTDLVNFKRQHYRWNFGNAQIFRDRLPAMLAPSPGAHGNWTGKLIYLACPGIYINAYLFPFAIAAAGFQVAALRQAPIPGETLCCAFMLGVLSVELMFETLTFVVLGACEAVPWTDRLRNIMAWWALSLNNARSTWAVLFNRTRPFEVTGKGSRRAASGAGSKSLETVFGLSILGLAALPAAAASAPWSLAALVLGILGALVLTILLLPADGGRE